MDDQLTDQQQAERVRNWLSENGWYLLGGLALGLAGLFGWRQWEASQLSQAEQAAALYAEMLAAVRVDRSARAEELAGQILADFGSSPYADQARLAMARVKLERSQPEESAKLLRETMERTASPELAHIARLRLARVLLQQEKYDEALKLLKVPGKSAFAPRYHELRGDTYFAMGRLDEARVEYEAAISGAEDGFIDQGFVQAKLDEVAAAAPAGAAAGAQSPAAR